MLPRYHHAESFQKDHCAPERAQTGSVSCTRKPETDCWACGTSVGSGQGGRRSQRGRGLGKPVAEPEGLIQRDAIVQREQLGTWGRMDKHLMTRIKCLQGGGGCEGDFFWALGENGFSVLKTKRQISLYTWPKQKQKQRERERERERLIAQNSKSTRTDQCTARRGEMAL